MGYDYISYVVYGAPETKQMAKDRVVTDFPNFNGCINHPQSFPAHVKGPYCITCGYKNIPIPIRQDRTLSLTEAYAPKEYKDDEDWENRDDSYLIRTNGSSGGDIWFGILIAEINVRDGDPPQEIREPSDEEKDKLRAYLKSIGYSKAELKTYLIPVIW